MIPVNDDGHFAETITTLDDLFRMLDSWFRYEGQFWDAFYRDRDKGVPFFIDAPDENLATWVEEGRLPSGRVLELGCGPGRNAVYLASRGFAVDAVDLSSVAIQWAQERAQTRGLSINWRCESIIDMVYEPGSYDLIYDSGCLHHITPHRRFTYLALVVRALKPGGLLGLTCFNPAMGHTGSEWDVYRTGKLGGGLSFSAELLRALFEPCFEFLELRPMREMNSESGLFGKDFLWVALLHLREESG